MPRSTRERLLDAGLKLFARDGLGATAVIDLESEAGLRPGSGSFYRHFGSKDELFVAVVERELGRVGEERHEERLNRATDIDPRVALSLELRRVLDNLSRRRVLIDLLARNRDAVRQHIEHADRAEQAASDGFRVNRDLLVALMDAGRIPRRDVDALITALASALIGYHTSSLFLGAPFGGVGADAIIAVLVDLVVT